MSVCSTASGNKRRPQQLRHDPVKKNVFHIVFFFAVLLCSFSAGGQPPVKNEGDEGVEQRIENLSESTEQEEADYTTLTDALQRYAEHPLNLNRASREELNDLQLLDDIQIDNLLRHIEKNGFLLTIYELQTVDGFNLNTIEKILPYVSIYDAFGSAHFSMREMFKNGSHEIVVRGQRTLETQKGYTGADSITLAENPNARYLGSAERVYARYRFTYSNVVSWGVIGDKDSGEEFFKGSQKNGFDFYTGHLSVRNIKFVKAVVLGDFQVSFGQGLTAWTGYAFGKTSDAASVKRNAMGIRPYFSTDENMFMRGGAAAFRFKKMETTVFYSRKKIDANITRSDTSGTDIEVLEVSSLQQTGLHTTPSELADKDAIGEQVFGGNVGFRSRRLNLGITAIHADYSASLTRNLDLYNQFEFSAKSNENIGFDYSYVFRNFNFFGEAAMSKNGAVATINGMLVSPDPKISFAVHHRYFQRDYQNLYANVFADGSLPANEQGIYLGMVARPVRSLTLTAYYDRFVFPWLRYRIDAPSNGSDFFTQVNFNPDKRTDMYFRYRHRDRFVNAGDEEADVDYIVPVEQTNYRFNIQYPVSPSVRLRNRIEYTIYEPTGAAQEKGFAIYQDVSYKKLGKKISFTARYALFQTDTYNARIYVYENDMRYVYSIPAYYYRGSRAYLLVNYDITRRLEVWVRIAQTFYNNQDVISEGSLTEIQGNTKTELKVQMRLKL
ncbi:MAG: hypothetical protein FD123_4054 [Bacteroidetes bacterium]|nr:MAG: hypothetical protein FD123_4054 [Bacteroidota bacterium]